MSKVCADLKNGKCVNSGKFCKGGEEKTCYVSKASNVMCPKCGTEMVTNGKSICDNGCSSETGKSGYLVAKAMQQIENKMENGDKEMGEKNFTIEDLTKMVSYVVEAALNNKECTQTELQKNCAQVAIQPKRNSVPVPVHVQPKIELNKWATTSKFKNAVMADGFIFNPYLHRRFITVQYLRIMKNNGNSVDYTINNCYDYMYSIKYLVKEVNKLVMLEKRDTIAFNERKRFFTRKSVLQIISDYVNDAIAYIDTAKIVGKKSALKKSIPGIGVLPAGELVEAIVDHQVVKQIVDSIEIIQLKESLKLLKEKVNNSYSYERLANILNEFRFISLPDRTKKSKEFVEQFKKSGAFYTMKNLIMFNGCNFSGENQKNSLNIINHELYSEKKAYVFHAMLKELLMVNNCDLAQMTAYNK